MKKNVKEIDIKNMDPKEAIKVGEKLGKRIGKLGDCFLQIVRIA